MKVWEDAQGRKFHDICFEMDESRDGYTIMDNDDLEDDDTCGSCGGVFLHESDVEDDDETDLP